MSNRLGRETSPYLLQHANNPVDWYPWGDEALARARAENRPILLSIGYAACHWCHVMAHESFEDQEIAALMNEHFINVKVDREERPDLDSIYQQALALIGQQGGWPLTMFLTPDGAPFWGGTYFPPTPRYGRPSFPQVLEGIAATFRQEPDKVQQNVSALREALDKQAATQPGPVPEMATLDRVAERLVREVDPFNGGIGDAPKFPQAPVLSLLWRAWHRTRKAPYRTAVQTTLTHMSQGGIYDHLGGGFARYAVDDAWLIPHFEKMLYDNAQLVALLTQAWQDSGNRLYAARVEETVEWLLREMRTEEGAFAGTLDADSEGEEGKFYVWERDEIASALGDDAPLFERIYGVRPGGNWEGVNILNRLSDPERFDPAEEQRLGPLRAKLLALRERRPRPGRDDKVLADWNGLAIAALADAGFAFDRPAWIAAAERAFAFIRDRMTDDEGRLTHSWRAGRSQPGTLDDHAAMANAALTLFEVTGGAAYQAAAAHWMTLLDRHFADPEGGGYYMTADDAESLIARPRSAHDHATPSGNGMAANALVRLWYLTGDESYRTRAESAIGAFAGEITRNFFPLATLLNAAELLQAAVQIVVIGHREDPAARTLLRTVGAHAPPTRILAVVPPGSALPESHPAVGKTQVQGRPTAYVCIGPTCSLGVTSPEDLLPLLRPGAP